MKTINISQTTCRRVPIHKTCPQRKLGVSETRTRGRGRGRGRGLLFFLLFSSFFFFFFFAVFFSL